MASSSRDGIQGAGREKAVVLEKLPIFQKAKRRRQNQEIILQSEKGHLGSS
ncbi:hypothetical protein ACS0TY_002993 [Phlomoides rotata]